ncbi:MAG TPA: ATP-binding protein, partial [Gemmatimonadaceae bacterium]|nr:ATP-binding protein [Gemmatimonadaceae bacterium]
AVGDINACDAIRHAIDLIEPLFGQKGLVFDGIASDGIAGEPAIIARGDPERVTQILVNLLSNSIKFTPKGGHISAECGGSGDSVTLRVSDTGIGIAAEKHDAIFEPFLQLRESLSDRESGVGLGLAISRDLARAMGGDLTVESALGKGASFTLTLPRGGELEQE